MTDNQTNAGNEKPKKKELTEQTKYKLYQKILNLDKSVKAIKQYELYVFVYKTIIQKAERLGDYKDAVVYKEKYEKLLDELQRESREKIYQHAVELKDNAKKAEDLQWIRKEIHRIPDYKDVEEIKKWCDEMQKGMEKREKRNAWIRLVIIVVVICTLAFMGTNIYEMFR